jgi:ParB-like chromosome segregation protein Spo0J
METKNYKISKIVENPYQPRTVKRSDTDQLSLAVSILHDGLLQSPVGRIVNGKLQLAYGHGRLDAYRLIAKTIATIEKSQTPLPKAHGLDTIANDDEIWLAFVKLCEAADSDYSEIPVTVREMTDKEMFETATAENIHRAGIGEIDKAGAMKNYIDTFGASVEDVAVLFGKSTSTIRNTIRLLQLPEPVRNRVNDKTLSINQALKLLSVNRSLPGAVVKIADEISATDSVEAVDMVIRSNVAKQKNVVTMSGVYSGDESPKAGNGLWVLDDFAPAGPRKLDAKKYIAVNQQHAREINDAFPDGVVDGLRGCIDFVSEALSDPETPAEDKTATRFASDYDLPLDVVEALMWSIQPGQCADCPFHAEIMKTHYCTDGDCHAWKTDAYKRVVAEQKALELGLEIYDGTDPVMLLGSENCPSFGHTDEGTYGEIKYPFDQWFVDPELAAGMKIIITPHQSGRLYHYTKSPLCAVGLIGATKAAFDEWQTAYKKRAADAHLERIAKSQTQTKTQTQQAVQDADDMNQKIAEYVWQNLGTLGADFMAMPDRFVLAVTQFVAPDYLTELPYMNTPEMDDPIDLLRRCFAYQCIMRAIVNQGMTLRSMDDVTAAIENLTGTILPG